MNYESVGLVRGVEESATLKLSGRAKELKAAGKSIVNFGAGEPDFNTDPTVIEKAFQRVKEGATKYTAVAGTAAARAAVANRISTDYGIGFSKEEVLLSNGGKQAIFHALQALIEPGDEVIIPSPYWVSFPEMVKMVGGIPRFIATGAGGIEKGELEKVVSPKTKLFILNSPSNPSGLVWSSGALLGLTQILLEKGIWLLSDDTYYRLVYEPAEFVSALKLNPSMRSQTCIIGSTSKSYAMTGWRLGWAIGPTALIKDMTKLQGQMTSSPSSISQAAVEVAVGEAHPVSEVFRNRFRKRRDLMISALNEIKGLSWVHPDGAFYVFLKVSDRVKGRSVSDWATELLEEHGVCVIPGEPFGEPDYVRLSYALDEASIQEGISRIAAALS